MKRLVIMSLVLTNGLMQAAQGPAQENIRYEYSNDNGTSWQTALNVPVPLALHARVMLNDRMVYDSRNQAPGVVVPGQPSRFRSFCSNFWQGTKDFSKGLVVGAGVTGVTAGILAYAKASQSYAVEAQHRGQLASIRDSIMASGPRYANLAVDSVKKYAKDVRTIVEKTGGTGVSYAPEFLKPTIEVSDAAKMAIGESVAAGIANMIPDSSVEDASKSMTGNLIKRVHKELSFGALCAGVTLTLSNLRELYESTSKAYVCGLLTAPVAAIAYGAMNLKR